MANPDHWQYNLATNAMERANAKVFEIVTQLWLVRIDDKIMLDEYGTSRAFRTQVDAMNHVDRLLDCQQQLRLLREQRKTSGTHG